MSGTIEPGWYDDGSGRHRWWDGTRWTGDHVDLSGLGQHPAAMPRVLQKTVDAPVMRHCDMCEHVDPQPRRLAARQAAIEKLDLHGNLGEDRVQRFIQDVKPRELRVVQVQHHAGAIRSFDPRRPKCGREW